MSVSEKKLNNIRRGARARAEGQAFENLFANACRFSGITVIHLPLGAKAIGSGRRPRLIQVKMPFDFILSGSDKRLAFLDAKSFSDDRVVYSALTPHQVEILSELESHGHKAGYVVHFKETGNVYFFKASLLQSLQRRESLLPEEGEFLGHYFNLNLKGFL